MFVNFHQPADHSAKEGLGASTQQENAAHPASNSPAPMDATDTIAPVDAPAAQDDMHERPEEERRAPQPPLPPPLPNPQQHSAEYLSSLTNSQRLRLLAHDLGPGAHLCACLPALVTACSPRFNATRTWATTFKLSSESTSKPKIAIVACILLSCHVPDAKHSSSDHLSQRGAVPHCETSARAMLVRNACLSFKGSASGNRGILSARLVMQAALVRGPRAMQTSSPRITAPIRLERSPQWMRYCQILVVRTPLLGPVGSIRHRVRAQRSVRGRRRGRGCGARWWSTHSSC